MWQRDGSARHGWAGTPWLGTPPTVGPCALVCPGNNVSHGILIMPYTPLCHTSYRNHNGTTDSCVGVRQSHVPTPIPQETVYPVCIPQSIQCLSSACPMRAPHAYPSPQPHASHAGPAARPMTHGASHDASHACPSNSLTSISNRYTGACVQQGVVSAAGTLSSGGRERHLSSSSTSRLAACA
jgi:hypothetical protein